MFVPLSSKLVGSRHVHLTDDVFHLWDRRPQTDQVPLPDARKDSEQFEQLKDWLASYRPEELFDFAHHSNIVRPEVRAILPKDESKLLGRNKFTYDNYQKLDVPEWLGYASQKNDQASPMKAVGRYLADIVERNVSRGPRS